MTIGLDSNDWIAMSMMLGLGFSGTYLWRFLGVLLANRLRADMPVVLWVEYVGYGLIAGILSRAMILPEAPLDQTPLWLRIFALLLSVALARLFAFHILMSLACGVGLFAGGLYALQVIG